MSQPIIALVGISGVGKSTLLEACFESSKFQHLQASQLIKTEREQLTSAAIDPDELRSGDITENQKLLIAGFHRSKDPTAPAVILDGHTVIDTPTGLVEIEPDVFRDIGVTGFIFLSASPAELHKRRSNDTSRNRPQREAGQLRDHQERAILSAFRAALHLQVPLSVICCSKPGDANGALISALIG